MKPPVLFHDAGPPERESPGAAPSLASLCSMAFGLDPPLIEAGDKAAPDPRAPEILAVLETLSRRIQESGDVSPVASRSLSLHLTAFLSELDERIHDQVRALLCAPPLRALESAWRSLESLLERQPEDELIRIRVLNVAREDLQDDFDDAGAYDRSSLFWLVYDNEYGRFEGEPFALLVSDLEFGPEHEDVGLLGDLAAVASAAHAVLLAAPAPELLDASGHEALSLRALRNLHDSPRFAAWNSLREREDARYVGLVFPRILLRLPYRPGDGQHLRLRESGPEPRLWGSGAFVLAALAMRSFHEFAWPAAIRGLAESQGVPDGLPREDSTTDRPSLVSRPPAEVVLTEAQERTLTELGLIPLCRVAGTPELAFFSLPTLHHPPRVSAPDVAANLLLSAQLPNVLCASRFAHYLKMILQAHVGRLSSREELQVLLSEFLAKYTLDDAQATPERKARYPLRKSELRLSARPGRPGVLDLIVQVQPHFLLQEPSLVLRLTVDAPEARSSST